MWIECHGLTRCTDYICGHLRIDEVSSFGRRGHGDDDNLDASSLELGQHLVDVGRQLPTERSSWKEQEKFVPGLMS